jgi:hypothetical protein
VRRTFRPDQILRVLNKHGVRYVVIGGFAATIYGSGFVTTDIDITPERGAENLERLSAALRELNARIRVEGYPDGLRFDHSGESLGRVDLLNLVTDEGDLDLSFVPAGTAGYSDLRTHAVTVRLVDLAVPVASLADVIRSKEAAGRPKDQLTVPTLRRILEQGGRYFSETELLNDGQVLLRLISTDISATPLVVQCQVTDTTRSGAGELAPARSLGEIREQPGQIQLRFPGQFETALGVPLPAGTYRVVWIQTASRERREVEREERIAESSFVISADGRFESVPPA